MRDRIYIAFHLNSEDSHNCRSEIMDIKNKSEINKTILGYIPNINHITHLDVDLVPATYSIPLNSKYNYLKRVCRATSYEGEDYWVVTEIFEVPTTTRFCLVRWHGYEGVDFDIYGFDQLTFAQEYMSEMYKKECEDLNIKSDSDYCGIDNFHANYDDGYETVYWQIYKLNNINNVFSLTKLHDLY